MGLYTWLTVHTENTMLGANLCEFYIALSEMRRAL